MYASPRNKCALRSSRTARSTFPPQAPAYLHHPWGDDSMPAGSAPGQLLRTSVSGAVQGLLAAGGREASAESWRARAGWRSDSGPIGERRADAAPLCARRGPFRLVLRRGAGSTGGAAWAARQNGWTGAAVAAGRRRASAPRGAAGGGRRAALVDGGRRREEGDNGAGGGGPCLPCQAGGVTVHTARRGVSVGALSSFSCRS